jgi:predicted nucleic acid-binding protein
VGKATKNMNAEKATIQDYIACAARLARALRTTPFYECYELSHAKGQHHKRGEVCPVCKENEAALLELERLSRLPVEVYDSAVHEPQTIEV